MVRFAVISNSARVALALLALMMSSAVSADYLDGRAATPPPVGSNEVADVGLSLLLIIAVILIVAYLFKRAQAVRGRDGDIMRVLATQPLGPKERILLVEIAGKQLVLGQTSSQIQTLHVLDEPLENIAQTPLVTSFAERPVTAIKGVRT